MKKRLDILLTEKGFATGRDKAKAVIMSGIVYVDGQKSDKPGMEVRADSNIEVRGDTLKYVSRGGLKLEKAIDVFSLNLNGKICADIGASTGGFTDCMLQNGALLVYAVDVGYGQLAWKLREDPRVLVMERTNIRHVTREDIPKELNFASVDVSFISLSLVLPVVYGLLGEEGETVCLIKPQFEAGREKVGKKGVVRDIEVHREVVRNVVKFSREIGFSARALDFSPIKGPEGNIEYLVHLAKMGETIVDDEYIDKIIGDSHNGAVK